MRTSSACSNAPRCASACWPLPAWVGALTVGAAPQSEFKELKPWRQKMLKKGLGLF